MFVVRFIRKDGMPNEEFYYQKIEDALYHFSLFEKDDSQLYSLVDVVHIVQRQEQQIAKVILEY